MVSVVFPAAGQGKRMGAGKNKILLSLSGKPVLLRTLELFSQMPEVEELIVVAGAKDMALIKKILQDCPFAPMVHLAPGGRERQQSVYNGLKLVSPRANIVLVHDAARPLVKPDIVRAVIREAEKSGAAIAAVPVKDTIKSVDAEGRVISTPDRSKLWAVQTPQGFQKKLLISAYQKAEQDGFLGTDDASLVEHSGHSVTVVRSDYENIKLTTPEDMQAAETFLGERAAEERKLMTRFGMGYDVHRLVPDRKLILGGVTIPFEKGLLGHSDADVLLHAVSDALLGAAGLGDIGRHFPDTDPRYEGADSLMLLADVREKLEKKGYVVGNVDATIVAQRPKLQQYIPSMQEHIARTLKIDADQVNVKATTEEKLGFTGSGEGISAYAVAGIEQR